MGATDRWRERIVLDVPGEVLMKILEVPDFNRPDRRVSFAMKGDVPVGFEEVKGTETLITPRDLPIHESVLERTKHGRRGLSIPETVSTPGAESQALKSWIASLAADPMQNQSDREPGGFVHAGQRNESQVSGMI